MQNGARCSAYRKNLVTQASCLGRVKNVVIPAQAGIQELKNIYSKNMKQINWKEFEKVELRVGTIIDVQDFPEAEIPAYKIKADFGNEIGIKQSSARITDLYTKEELLNKQIIGIVNFPPKQIGPFISEFLCAGFYRENKSVVLAVPDKKTPNGSKLA